MKWITTGSTPTPQAEVNVGWFNMHIHDYAYS